MNKIIRGKRYDTETAKELAVESWSYPNNFDWWQETLYQKRTGEFFLHGEGGANSKYAEAIEQNCWGSGEKIIPLSYEEAQEWAEKYLDADEYEKIFGKIQDGSTVISLSISNEANAKLKRMATEKGISASALVEKMLLKA